MGRNTSGERGEGPDGPGAGNHGGWGGSHGGGGSHNSGGSGNQNGQGSKGERGREDPGRRDNAKGAFGGIADGLADAAKGLADGLSEAAKGAVNGVKGAFGFGSKDSATNTADATNADRQSYSMTDAARTAVDVSGVKAVADLSPVGLPGVSNLTETAMTHNMTEQERAAFDDVESADMPGWVEAGIKGVGLLASVATQNPGPSMVASLGVNAYNHGRRANAAKAYGVDMSKNTSPANPGYMSSGSGGLVSSGSQLAGTPSYGAMPTMAMPDYGSFNYGTHLDKFQRS